MSAVQRLLAVGLLVATIALATGASPTGEGIAGEFELYYSRTQPGNPAPSLEFTVEGVFAAQDYSFFAEMSVPLPGGSDERIALIVRGTAREAYVLYPDTFNYRAISADSDTWKLLELVPFAISTQFGAVRDALKKRGIQLSYLGHRKLDGEQLRAFSVSMKDVLLPEAIEKGDSEEWSVTLYFGGLPERLRAAQAKSAMGEIRIMLSDVRHEDVPIARFEIPKDYYALEPLIISEETLSAKSDD